MGGWWRWALVSPDRVAHSRMVYVSASVNLPLHHKVRSSLLAPAHLGGPGNVAVKWLCVFVCVYRGHPQPFPKLHLGPSSSVGMWRGTDTQTAVTTIHFVSAVPHPKCNTLTTGGFCWSKVWLSACPYWQQLANLIRYKMLDARVFLSSVTYKISVP